MARESRYIYDESFTANSDLSAKQFYMVKFVADNKVDIVTTSKDIAIGVLQNKPKSGEAAAVRFLGMTKAIADGSGTAISAGDPVGPNASGIMIKKNTADFGVVGTACQGTSVANIEISVLLPAFGYGVFRTRLDT